MSRVPESEIRKPVADMLEWVGLGARADARPATLSGGEQQRVAIARAVIARPEILVADEPTGNVDPDMALKLLRLFEALNRLGTTVVVATHDVHLLKKVPDSLIMRLDKGRLADPDRRAALSAAAPAQSAGRAADGAGRGHPAQPAAFRRRALRLLQQARLAGRCRGSSRSWSR